MAGFKRFELALDPIANLFLAGVALAAIVPAVVAQQGWLVKPEWVRAHEDFLASDALAGRGSATRDEQIAAEYVAAEFEAYGLRTAPGMTGYIQAADVVAPELDGRATLMIGNTAVIEGDDLRLLVPSGVNATGPIFLTPAASAKGAKVPKGSVLVLTGLAVRGTGLTVAYPLRRSGATLILFEEDEGLREFLAKNPRGRAPLRLKENTEALPATMAAVSKAVMERLVAAKATDTVSLTVHVLPSKARRTFNAVGYLEGTDPASGTILLSAHLDHLGVTSAPVNGDAIYNGANDDASGTTAVMELAHALAAGPKLRRSILFVCYGSEEVGELGSEYFGRHSPVPLVQIVTNLEFEMIGAQDPKMPNNMLLLTGWERSNLGLTLREHGALLGADPYPEERFFERSDNYQLALDGVVAQTAAGWGTVPSYHQLNDDLAHLNFEFLRTVIQSMVEPIRWLAESDFKPAWNPGGQPKR